MTDSITSLHYAANGNYVNGVYAPGADGFNLADVSSVSVLNAMPSGVEGLVYVGMTDGVTAAFKTLVSAFLGNSRVYGFYLADEPGASAATAANLKAESDYIHANFAGAKTFMVEQNLSGQLTPQFYYTPANTGIDLFGLDPYPVRSDLPGGFDLATIGLAVQAAEAAGIAQSQLVPVYQAFGGGSYGPWVEPTATQESQILSTWGQYLPTPAFDYAYSWGAQSGDMAISSDPALQQVFAAHNALTAGGGGGSGGGGGGAGGAITIGGNGAAGVIYAINVTGLAVTVLGNSNVNVVGPNNTIAAGTSVNLHVNGSADAIVAAAGDGLWLDGGGGLNVQASSASVTLAAQVGATIIGAWDQIAATAGGAVLTVGGNGANGGDDVVTGSNASIIELTNSHMDLVGAGDTIILGANSNFGLSGSNDAVYATAGDRVWLKSGTADVVEVGPIGGKLIVRNFAPNAGDVIDLLRGAGGFASVGAVLASLSSDGLKGSLLNLGNGGSIDFLSVKPTAFIAADFAIG